MAKEAILQVRMDSEIKEQAELLYKQLGTSFAEAVRIFAKQSIEEQATMYYAHVFMIFINQKRQIIIIRQRYLIRMVSYSLRLWMIQMSLTDILLSLQLI